MITKEFAESLSGLLFPAKLWKLATNKDVESVKWSEDGLILKIDSVGVEKECFMPHVFNVTSNQHVLRQLSYYQFEKIDHKTKMWEFKHPSFRADREDLVRFIRRQGQKMLKKYVPDYEKRRSTRIRKKSEKGISLSFADSESDSDAESDGNFKIKEVSDSPFFVNSMKKLDIKVKEDSEASFSGNTKKKSMRGRKKKICYENSSPSQNMQNSFYHLGSAFEGKTYRELGIRKNIFSFPDKENSFGSFDEDLVVGASEKSHSFKDEGKRSKPLRSQTPSDPIGWSMPLTPFIKEENFENQYMEKYKLDKAIANDPFMNNRNMPPITDNTSEQDINKIMIENDKYLKVKPRSKKIFENNSEDKNIFTNYGLRLVSDDKKHSLIQGVGNKIYVQMDGSDNFYELEIEGGKFYMDTTMISNPQNTVDNYNREKVDHCYSSSKSSGQFSCDNNSVIRYTPNASCSNGFCKAPENSYLNNGQSLLVKESTNTNQNHSFFHNEINDGNLFRKSVITPISEAHSPTNTLSYPLCSSGLTGIPASSSGNSNAVENSELDKYFAGTTVPEFCTLSKDSYDHTLFNPGITLVQTEYNFSNELIPLNQYEISSFSDHLNGQENLVAMSPFDLYSKSFNQSFGDELPQADFSFSCNMPSETNIDVYKGIDQEENTTNQNKTSNHTFNSSFSHLTTLSENIKYEINVPDYFLDSNSTQGLEIEKTTQTSSASSCSDGTNSEVVFKNGITSENKDASPGTDGYLFHDQVSTSNDFKNDTQKSTSLKSGSVEQHVIAKPSSQSLLFPDHPKRDKLMCNEIISNSTVSNVSQQLDPDENPKKDPRTAVLKFLQDQIAKDVKFKWEVMNGQLIIDGLDFESTNDIQNWIKEKY